MAGTFTALEWARTLQLPAPEKALMYAVVSYLDQNNQCFPGQDTLASDAGLGERTVRRYLRVWERAGIVSRTPRMRSDGRGRTSDLITVNVDRKVNAAAYEEAWRIEKERDQPAAAAGPGSDDQPAKSDDQPAADARTNRPTNGRGTTSRSTSKESAADRSNDSEVCARCGCSTDRPGSYRVKRKDVVCLHEVAS